jgi:hypothetical protein
MSDVMLLPKNDKIHGIRYGTFMFRVQTWDIEVGQIPAVTRSIFEVGLEVPVEF